MQKLDMKTVAAGIIRVVAVAVLGADWSFFIMVKCRGGGIFRAREKSGPVGGLRLPRRP